MSGDRSRESAASLACHCSLPDNEGVWPWVRLAAAAFLAINIMSLSLSVNLSETTSRERTLLLTALIGGTVLVAILAGGALVANAWNEFRQRRVTIESLFLLAIAGATGQSSMAAATGRGNVYFEVVAVLLVVYAFGRRLVSRSQQAAMAALSRVRAEVKYDLVLPDGTTKLTAAGELKAGDTVLIKPGASVPVDGVVVSGRACLQEAQITGEGFLRATAPGDPVLAGACPVDAAIHVQATAAASSSRLSCMLDQVAGFLASPSHTEMTANRLARWFVPVVLGAAVLTTTGWSLARDWGTGIMHGLAVLLIACPCALGFATPLTFWSAVRRMAAFGLAVKGGDAVERLASVRTVIFDKTGTLTSSKWRIARVRFFAIEGLSEPLLRRLIAAAEHASNHPVAAAFEGFDADTHGPTVTVLSVQVLPGIGFRARLRSSDGQPWDLSIGLAEQLLADFPLSEEEPGEAARRVAVLVGGLPAGIVDVEERLLETAGDALRQLHQAGIETVLATGDVPVRAKAVPAARHYASLKAEDKAALVRAQRSTGRSVLFVGDGLNDTVAMAAADVSIAAPGSVDLTSGIADGVLLTDDLRALPRALKTAHQALHVGRTNLYYAAAYNAAGIAVAAAGLVHPVTSVLLMTCSSLFVSWRAARLLPEHDTGAERIPI